MHLVIFGATGNVGRRVALGALRRGHQVTGVVRDPAAAQPPDPGVRLVPGDATGRRTSPGWPAAPTRWSAPSRPGPTPAASPPRPWPPTCARSPPASAQAGVNRILYVGGAGSLEVAPGQVLADQPGFPAAYQDERGRDGTRWRCGGPRLTASTGPI